MTEIVTRFAPSPTGFLHIGNARTAIFSYLFARRHAGKFLLRVEDTNKAKSTPEAVEAIFDGMKWLGLEFDGDFVMQSGNEARHREVAKKLLEIGSAYECYVTQEELENLRSEAEEKGEIFRFKSPYRDQNLPPKAGISPTIRLKSPSEGEIINDDLVQGKVSIPASEIDDLIILRSDGTPTYMLAAVVDDHDMGVTHVIRGDDHLTNTVKQIFIYEQMGWKVPKFAHLPLLHGSDGAKLSKRHGALGVMDYEKMGYLPEAIFNYLLRLGWSHQNDEIISKKEAISWFNLEAINKAPARIDLDKLNNLNFHYIKTATNEKLAEIIKPKIEKMLSRILSEEELEILIRAMESLKTRSKDLNSLAESALFFFQEQTFTPEAREILLDDVGISKAYVEKMLEIIEKSQDFLKDSLMAEMEKYAQEQNVKLGQIAKILRPALTGLTVSPSIFDIIIAFGKERSCIRLNNLLKSLTNNNI